MPGPRVPHSATAASPSVFPSTHWSVVVAAGSGDTTPSSLAFERLCQSYWPPIYAYLRRRGFSKQDAEDLTQGFFGRLLDGRPFAALEPAKGRFRSWLLVVLKHHLGHELEKAHAQKRGGGVSHVPFDELLAESRLDLSCAATIEPDQFYDRHWALTLLARAADRLQASYLAEGHPELHQELRGYVSGEASTTSYAETATRLGMTESAVKSAVHRMRQRYQQFIRDEVAQTVATPGEVDDELRELIAVMAV